MYTSPNVPTGNSGNVRKLLHRLHLGDIHLRQAPADWETPYAWLHEVRRWSPAVVPPVLGLLLVFIATLPLPAATSASSGAAPNSMPLLFVLYFVCGVIYGLALHLAPSLDSWAKTLLGGAFLYGLAALWFIGGLLVLTLSVIVCLGLGIYYVHRCLHSVPAEMLHITTLAGRYWRAIPTGRSLLLPGERLRLRLPNPAKDYTTPLVQVYLADIDGNRWVIQALVTASYRFSPVDALNKRTTPDDWEDELKKTVRETLRDVLAILGHSAIEAPPRDAETGQYNRNNQDIAPIEGQQVAHMVLEQLRRYAIGSSMAIGWVRIRDLLLTPDSRFSAPAARQTSSAAIPQMSGAGQNRSVSPAPPPAASAQPDELPVEALLDLYDMVRQGTITDPETVRSIALAFKALSSREETRDSSPYDTDEVADLLLQYAASLQH